MPINTFRFFKDTKGGNGGNCPLYSQKNGIKRRFKKKIGFYPHPSFRTSVSSTVFDRII